MTENRSMPRKRRALVEVTVVKVSPYLRAEKPLMWLSEKEVAEPRLLPIAVGEFEAAAIQMQLSGEPEVRSALIGQAMMDRLQRTDEIAYVRYASVYRSFEDVSAFSKEVDRLRREKGAASNITQLSLLSEKVSEEK